MTQNIARCNAYQGHCELCEQKCGKCNFSTNYYIDLNYPGVTYIVLGYLKDEFVSYMEDEGAAIKKVKGIYPGNDTKHIKGIYQTTERWGLEFQEDDYELFE